MSYKSTRADHYLDDQGMLQVDLDAALNHIEREMRVALKAIRLTAAASTDEDRREYLLVVLDAFSMALRHKELARVAAGDMDISRRELRRLHLVPSESRWAGAEAQVA